jgi:hypothetical protein
MPSPMPDNTEDGAPQLAAIELRYERAKAHIAGVAVPLDTDGSVHDTVAVDVRLTRPPLIPARRRVDGGRGRGAHRMVGPAPATEAPQGGPRLWRFLRLPRLVQRSLPAS